MTMKKFCFFCCALVIVWACYGSDSMAADAPGANDSPVVTSKMGAIKIAKCDWILFSPDGNKAHTLPALRLTSEDGHDGYWVGESWMSQKPDVVQPVLDKLKGMDVSTPEQAYATLAKMQMPFQLLLGLDIAIWDLFGRCQGKPVAELLGPRKRDKVALYLAGVPNLDAQQIVALALAAKKRGAQAFKIYTYLDGYGPKRDPANAEEAAKWLAQDIAIARAVREAVGDAYPLMFYNGCSYNLAQAIQVGKVLDELHYALFYDPMPENTPDSMANYLALKKSITTPICAPVSPAQSADRITWMDNKAMDMNEIDVYTGFTPCLQVVRACAKAGIPVDLHGGFPSDYYQFPLYAFVDDTTLPRIGWHLMNPKWLPAVMRIFLGSVPGDPTTPWIKRTQNRPVDAEGFIHLNYDVPGMGVEFDWDWIVQHDIAALAPAVTPAAPAPVTPAPVVTTPAVAPPAAPTPAATSPAAPVAATAADTLVLPRVNAEAKGYIDMLRPFLEQDYNPLSGPDKDRPSLKDAARKIAEDLPAQLSVPTAPKRKILVLTYGTFGTLHIPGAGGLLSLLRDTATKYGAFELTELYSSDGIDAKLLNNFDAVVVNNVGQNWKPQADKLYNQLLQDYVKNGGGLFADHGAALLYMNKPDAEYNNLLGGFVEASPLLVWQVHTLKDHCSPFYIKLPEPDNPLAASFQGETKPFTMQSCQLNGDKRVEWPVTFNTPLQLADELYAFSPHSNKDKATRVVVSLDVAKNTPGMFPADWPAFSHALVWMRPYGKGRVFYSALGHNQAIFSVPCVARMMLDGLQYATGDLKVPDIAVLPPDDDATPPATTPASATAPATTPAAVPTDPTLKPAAQATTR